MLTHTTEEERAMDQELGYVLGALYKIREVNGKKRGVSGVIDCPKCHGKLHYSISSYNGHIHGKCETQGCVSWVQ